MRDYVIDEDGSVFNGRILDWNTAKSEAIIVTSKGDTKTALTIKNVKTAHIER